MKTYTYKFSDGIINAIEVSNELYAVCEYLDDKERNNDKRETRRHISLTYLNENGIDIEDMSGEPLTVLMRKEETAKLENALSQLLPQQRELIESIFFDGLKAQDIADAQGVDKSAISHRLERIFKKLKNFSVRPSTFVVFVGISRGVIFRLLKKRE